MASQEIAIVYEAGSLSHTDACRIYEEAVRAVRLKAAKVVVIDLKCVRDATTSAFAKLVLLRRALLQMGRDLRLVNLSDRAAHLFGINRLAGVLPCG